MAFICWGHNQNVFIAGRPFFVLSILGLLKSPRWCLRCTIWASIIQLFLLSLNHQAVRWIIVDVAQSHYFYFEGGTFTKFTGYFHLSAHFFNYFFANTKAKSCSSVVAPFVLLQLWEVLKEFVKVFLFYTFSRISDLHAELQEQEVRVAAYLVKHALCLLKRHEAALSIQVITVVWLRLLVFLKFFNDVNEIVNVTLVSIVSFLLLDSAFNRLHIYNYGNRSIFVGELEGIRYEV